MEMTTRNHERGHAPSLPTVGVGGAITVYVAAALSLVAALIHLWATPEHIEEWWGYGAFMLGSASAQGFFAVAVLALRPERKMAQYVFVVAIAGNLAVVLLYIVTRTVGIPFFGPHAGEVESAGFLDMSSTVAELGLIVALVTLLGGRLRSRMVGVLLILGAGLWALRLLGFLT